MVGGGFVAGSIISKLVMDTSKWDKSTKAVVSRTTQLGNKLGKFGSALSAKVTLPLALAGAAAVKASADFEQKLVNAFSVTGSSSEAVKQQMSDLAREMGATTVFAATEAADAMYYMASAGWKADDMTAALKDTLDLAAATQTDLAFATSTVISTLNQFNLTSDDANRITNVFASAISNSQATMDRLGKSMQYVGPVMNSMGKSVEETSSLLMGLYNAGFEASMAGTALRMGIAKLMIPTDRAANALGGLGLTFDDVNPKTHKMADIIQLLGDRGADTKDIFEIFGIRAGPAFAALISKGGDALRKYEDQITGTNRAAEMAEMQIDTFKGSFKLLTSALTESAISIGNVLAPSIRKMAEGITGLVTKFNELGPQTKGFILTLAGIAAALGPLAMILGKVLILVDKIKLAMIVSKSAFLISAAGVGILVAALAALVIGYMKVTKARDEANAAAKRAADAEDNLWAKLKKAADAAGMTNREFAELTNKYKLNAAAAAMAIKRGQEGAEIQKELAKVSAEHKKEIDKQKAAMDDSIPTVADLTAEFNKLQGQEDEAKKKAEEFANFLKSLGIKTIEEKADRVKDLSGKLDKLNQLYKDGKLGLKEYVEGSNKVKKEIEELSTTLVTVALPAASLTSTQIASVYAASTGEMQQHTQDFTEHLRTKSVEAINVGQEMSDTFRMSFKSNLEGLILGTTSWKDAVVGIFGDLKAKFASIVADMATNWIMGFAQKLITGTLESTTSVASQLTSTAGDILKQVGSWSPGGIVGSAIQGAVSGLFSGIFGGKGMSKETAKHIQQIVDFTSLTRDALFIDILPMFWQLIERLDPIRDSNIRIKNLDDVRNSLLSVQANLLKEISKEGAIIADKMKNLKSAQGGNVFTGTELAVLHGTPAAPEIAAPVPMLSNAFAIQANVMLNSLMAKLAQMKADPTTNQQSIQEFEKLIADKTKQINIEKQHMAVQKQNVNMQTALNIQIDVKDQLDPNKAQEITREQILPQILRAVEVNDRQFRTKFEEILKMRI